MNEYDCPVDGCEHSGNLDSIRGHVNGSNDPDHEWSELKQQIEAQSNHPEGGLAEGDEPGDGAVSDPSNDDQPAEGGETSQEGAAEGPSEEGTMATDDEYETQTSDDQGESPDENTNETSDGGGSNPSTEAGAAAAGAGTALIAGQSVWVIVSIAGLALLVVLLVTGEEGEPTAESAMETSDEGGREDPSEGGSKGGSDGETGGLI